MSSLPETFSCSVPGKTFLVGEYLALSGGPSLVLTTAPRFGLKVVRGAGGAIAFVPRSPAGRLLASETGRLRGFDFEFDDPHRGRGGLGASSAQFALAYAWLNGFSSLEPRSFDWRACLSAYRASAWDGEGSPPSGADLVAQLTGGVTWFDGMNWVARRMSWAFQNLGFTLIRTGQKLATHEHLREEIAIPRAALAEQVEMATFALQSSDEMALVNAVRSTGVILRESGLVAPGSVALLGELESAPGVLAVKGCGAMGADVLLALHGRDQAQALRDWLSRRDLEICGTQADLCPEGLMGTLI